MVDNTHEKAFNELAPASSVASSVLPEKKRRRPPLACEQCRRRKIKCDKDSPCGHCIRARIPNCTYARVHIPAARGARGRSSMPFVLLGTASESAAQRPVRPAPPSESRQNLGETSHAGTDSLSPSKVSTSVPGSTVGSTPGSSNVDYLIARVHELEEKLAKVVRITEPKSSSAFGQANIESLPLRKGTISKTRYFGNSHWANITDLLRTEFGLLGQAEAEKGEVYQALSKCKTLGRKIKTNRQRPLSSNNLGQSIPAKELTDKLIEKYLCFFEGALRVLHIPTFRLEYDRYWQNPSVANLAFVMQLQLCLALGATVYDQIFSLRTLAMHWVAEAQLWLVLPPEKSKMTMTGIQTWCLLVMAKSFCGVGQDLTWVTMGSLIRLAMYMGLHRDPKHLGKITVYRAEIRRRLWATILELNLQFSFEAGGSPLLQTTDYDTEPPSNLNDDQLVDEDDGEVPIGRSIDVPTQSSVQLTVLNSMPLRLNLIRTINDFQASRTYEEVLRLNSELTKACRELSSRLSRLQTKDKEASPSSVNYFHVAVAEMFIYRFFHALHQTVIAKSFNDHRFYFSRRMCLDSALKLLHLWGISGLRSEQQPEGMLEFRRIVDNGSGVFRYIAMQSLFYVAVELIHQKQGQSASLGYLPSMGDLDLRSCLDAAKVWTLDRVRAGETNGKGHCFVAACLGHIDALSAGLSNEQIDDAILKATTNSANQWLAALIEVAEREGVVAVEESPSDAVEIDGVTMMPLEWLSDWQWDDMDGLT